MQEDYLDQKYQEAGASPLTRQTIDAEQKGHVL